jgi:site-specific DNA-methyltransferase (adenine-specific)
MIQNILHGDCLELMKNIPDGSIDMILCDLPYGTTACKWDVIIPFDKLWEQYERIIKKNGAIVLTASQPFTSALVMSNPKMFKYEWIWEKNTGSNFATLKKMPFKQHENIIIFGKGKILYNPQMQYKKYNSINRLKYNIDCMLKGDTETNKHKRYYSEEMKNSNLRYPSSVQKFIRQMGLHPTQKPIALFEYLIKTYTNENDLVLDNCAGSGTTAIACLNTNRQFIVMEKEQNYFDIINKRVKEHIIQTKLF